MKKVEKIIYEHYGCKSWEEVCKDFLSEVSPTMIKEIVKIAQIDAIEETVSRCANKATTMDDPHSYCGNTGSEYPPDIIVNKQSILQVAEELKKEL